ncbi:MAG: polysaccharide deacetylase family protein, partial [Deferrisomatales bacterium]
TREAAVTLDGNRVFLTDRNLRWKEAKAFLARVCRLAEAERGDVVEEVCARLGVSSEQAWNRTPMLTWDQVREMAEAGMEIGAHTVTHPVLSLLTPERQEQEIRESVETLERRLGVRPRCFAYPNGRAEDFDDTTVSLLRSQGLEAAYTTILGTNSAASDPYRLKRGAGWSHQAWRYGLQMLWYRWTT